jgi:type IV pilus assembly protein PilA
METNRPTRRLARRIADDRGFTLIELLVVILIVGILAAIALPAFINQRQKGYDTAAKTTLRTALVAITSHEINEGTYAATAADLVAIEPSLGDANNLTVAGTATTFTMTEESDSLTVFTVSRDAAGKTTRDCSAPGTGLCKSTPDANGNRW